MKPIFDLSTLIIIAAIGGAVTLAMLAAYGLAQILTQLPEWATLAAVLIGLLLFIAGLVSTQL